MSNPNSLTCLPRYHPTEPLPLPQINGEEHAEWRESHRPLGSRVYEIAMPISHLEALKGGTEEGWGLGLGYKRNMRVHGRSTYSEVLHQASRCFVGGLSCTPPVICYSIVTTCKYKQKASVTIEFSCCKLTHLPQTPSPSPRNLTITRYTLRLGGGEVQPARIGSKMAGRSSQDLSRTLGLVALNATFLDIYVYIHIYYVCTQEVKNNYY